MMLELKRIQQMWLDDNNIPSGELFGVDIM